MAEVWKDVVRAEGIYSVNDRGAVRREAGGRGARVGRILKPTYDRSGYRRVILRINGKSRLFFEHTLVMAAFVGPKRAGYEIHHRNGLRDDNRLENLEYMSRDDHKKTHGKK